MKLQNKRSPLLALLTAIVLTTQVSCGRSSQASNRPSAAEQAAIDQILQRYEEALGGRQAIDGLTSYKMEGSFQLAGMNGRIAGWRKEPDKTLTVLDFPRFGTLKKGFDGETRWVQT